MFDSSFYRDENVRVINGDSSLELQFLPSQSAHCCVTSPPYFGLRDYGVDGQIGLERTPQDYIDQLVEVFREVRRVLRDDGTLWLNLGDSYNAYNGNRGKSTSFQSATDEACPSLPKGFGLSDTSLKNKDLIGIPWRVAFALQADGWYLRQDIIWHKTNAMPESVRDRCTKAHEYIFLLSKSPKYYFDNEAIKEPAVCGANGSEFHTGKNGEHQLGRASKKPRPSAAKGSFNGKTEVMASTGQNAFRAIVDMRNRRSVWTVSTKPYKAAHFATFPADLIEPCVLAGCPEGGTVLDPFAGSGTTLQVARSNHRKSIGIELNPEYCGLICDRLGVEKTTEQTP